MVESKYFESLNKLIADIFTSNKESCSSLQKSTNALISEINVYTTSNNANPSESDMRNIFSNYFTNQLRLKYQKEIINNISDESLIISKGIFLCEYIFWLIIDTKFITFKQSLKLLQDLIETIPFLGLEELFNLMSSSLKKLDNSFIEQGKLDILLIQNIFLKRTNNNLDSSLRGKILLLFCDLFSITEKSGTNIKGKYSSNQVNEEISAYSNDNSDTVINDEDDVKMQNEKNKEKEKADDVNKMEIEEDKKEIDKKDVDKKNIDNIKDLGGKNEKIKLYEQFWIIEKILISPFMVC